MDRCGWRQAAEKEITLRIQEEQTGPTHGGCYCAKWEEKPEAKDIYSNSQKELGKASWLYFPAW